jgi:hypothetical protein
VTSFNRHFVELWRIPESLIAARDDQQLLQFVLDQLLDPEGFLAKVRASYQTPDKCFKDELAFKDGRVFERYSQPQRIGDTVVGRVWSFRDVTERRQAEAKLTAQLDELSRWHDALLGREGRVLEVKQEVNQLLARLGQPPRYASVEEGGGQSPVTSH